MPDPRGAPVPSEPEGPSSPKPPVDPAGPGGRALEALARILARITASLDLQETLQSALDVVRETFAADVAIIRVIHAESTELTLAASAGLTDEEAAQLPLRMSLTGDGISAQVARTRAPVCLGLQEGLARHQGAARWLLGQASVVCVPLVVRETLVGTLLVGARPGRVFGGDDLALAGAIAQVVGPALERAALYGQVERLYADALRAKARADALAEIGQAISSSLDLDEVLSLVVERTAGAIGADGIALLEWEAASRSFRVRRAGGLSDRYQAGLVLHAGAGVVGAVLAAGKPEWTADISADRRLSVPDAAMALIAAEGLRGILWVPVRGREGPYGVLSLYWRSVHPFDEEEIAFAVRIADQAAIAIENARLHGERVRKQEEAEALQTLARLISSTFDADEIFRVLLERTCSVLGVGRCAVWEAEREGDELRLRLFRTVGLNPEFWEAFPLSVGEGTTGGCIARRAPVWTADLRNDPAIQASEEIRRRVAAEGYRAVCSAPILLPDGPFGALAIYRDEPHEFTPREVALLSAFADQAAIAIRNARLFQEEQARRRQLEAVRAVTVEIIHELDLTALLGLIHERAAALVGAVSGAVWLWDETAQVLVPRAWHGLGEWVRDLRLRLGQGLTGLVAQERQGRIVTEYRRWSSALPLFLERTAVAVLLAEPLLYRERLLGVITLANDAAGRPFTAQDRATIALFANQAAIAIENARLYAQTRRAYEDLRAAHEQLVRVEKLRALGEMAGGVAHDFNNLLAAILGQAQLLQLRTTDPRARQGLAVIERAALDGAETVRRILGFARVRAEGQSAPVDLAALIPEALEVTRPRWKDEVQARGVVIEAGLAVEPVPTVPGHAAELREVLVNLILNAVDAMPHGGRLTVGVRRAERPARPGALAAPASPEGRAAAPEIVEAFVQDTGVGMSEEVRRRAFEPFFTTKGVKGTGLGLSMAYGIIARHGGELRIESREGAGTTVAFRLPASAQPAADPEPTTQPAAGLTGRIVVVDDDQVVGDVLAEMLRLKHHRVHAFTDPRRALEHLAREPADLLFTDLGMPEMSGWEVARRAHELRADLPVVLVSGWGQQIDPAEVRKSQVSAVVAKPYRVQDILRVVAEFLPSTRQG